jgi:hypothetical protein
MPALNENLGRRIRYRAKKRNPRHRCMLRGHWVHVSSRVVRGRYAFVPPEDGGLFVLLMWGIIGRAQIRYGVDVAIAVVASNHLHCLLRSDRPGAVSAFMQYVKSGFARLTHKTYETSGPVWDGPFRASTILDVEAEEFWFAYILAHLTKDGVTPRPNQWPGLQCVDHLLNGTSSRGLWFDYQAWDSKGRPDDRTPFYREVIVKLTPLTGWERYPAERYRAFCEKVFDDVVADHADKHFVGVPAALAVSPMHEPAEVKRSRCPAFSAMGPLADELLKAAYEARREGTGAVMAAVAKVVEQGRAAVTHEDADPEHPWSDLPDGFDYPPLINDAFDDAPIVGPFLPPDAALPKWPAKWGDPPRVIGDG